MFFVLLYGSWVGADRWWRFFFVVVWLILLVVERIGCLFDLDFVTEVVIVVLDAVFMVDGAKVECELGYVLWLI